MAKTWEEIKKERLAKQHVAIDPTQSIVKQGNAAVVPDRTWDEIKKERQGIRSIAPTQEALKETVKSSGVQLKESTRKETVAPAVTRHAQPPQEDIPAFEKRRSIPDGVETDYPKKETSRFNDTQREAVIDYAKRNPTHTISKTMPGFDTGTGYRSFQQITDEFTHRNTVDRKLPTFEAEEIRPLTSKETSRKFIRDTGDHLKVGAIGLAKGLGGDALLRMGNDAIERGSNDYQQQLIQTNREMYNNTALINDVLGRKINADLSKSEMFAQGAGEVVGGILQLMGIGYLMGGATGAGGAGAHTTGMALKGVTAGTGGIVGSLGLSAKSAALTATALTGAASGAISSYSSGGDAQDVITDAITSSAFFLAGGLASKKAGIQMAKVLTPIYEQYPHWGVVLQAAVAATQGATFGAVGSGASTAIRAAFGGEMPTVDEVIKSGLTLAGYQAIMSMLARKPFQPYQINSKQTGEKGGSYTKYDSSLSAQELKERGYVEVKGTGIWANKNNPSDTVAEMINYDGVGVYKRDIWAAERSLGRQLTNKEIKRAAQDPNYFDILRSTQGAKGKKQTEAPVKQQPTKPTKSQPVEDQGIKQLTGTVEQQKSMRIPTEPKVASAKKDPVIQNPKPTPKGDLPVGTKLNTTKYGPVTVVDNSDPSFVRLKNQNGTELTVGRKALNDMAVPDTIEMKQEPKKSNNNMLSLVDEASKVVQESMLDNNWGGDNEYATNEVQERYTEVFDKVRDTFIEAAPEQRKTLIEELTKSIGKKEVETFIAEYELADEYTEIVGSKTPAVVEASVEKSEPKRQTLVESYELRFEKNADNSEVYNELIRMLDNDIAKFKESNPNATHQIQALEKVRSSVKKVEIKQANKPVDTSKLPIKYLFDKKVFVVESNYLNKKGWVEVYDIDKPVFVDGSGIYRPGEFEKHDLAGEIVSKSMLSDEARDKQEYLTGSSKKKPGQLSIDYHEGKGVTTLKYNGTLVSKKLTQAEANTIEVFLDDANNDAALALSMMGYPSEAEKTALEKIAELQKVSNAPKKGINKTKGGDKDVSLLEEQNDGVLDGRKTEPSEKPKKIRETGQSVGTLEPKSPRDPGTTVSSTPGEQSDNRILEEGDRGNKPERKPSVPSVVGSDVEGDNLGPDLPNDLNHRFENFEIDTTRPSATENLNALKLMRKIIKEGREATPDEQRILARYKGWGGLKQSLVQQKYGYNRNLSELKTLVSDKEFHAIQASMRNAHYTAVELASIMYDGLKTMGFNGGKILEPSMGTGNFFGVIPEDLNRSKLYGVELDTVTGNIAKLLYPQANIQITGFQDAQFKDNFFDVAIGNVPFGETTLTYKGKNYLLHDYFFVKTADKLREGGVMAYITSTGTMDKISPKLRKQLSETMDLITAVRLPSTTFSINAGTEVTTDLIVLRKRESGKPSNGVDWLSIGKIKDIPINQYFVDHPENLLGELVYEKNMYGGDRTQLRPDGRDHKESLREIMNNLPKVISAPNAVEKLKTNHIENVFGYDKYSFTNHNGSLYYIDGDVMKPVKSNIQKIQDYLKVKEAFSNVINGTNKEMDRARLNEVYNNFKEAHGPLQHIKNKALREDTDFDKVAGLEILNPVTKELQKSEIFTRDTLTRKPVERSETAYDSLIVSLGETAKVDIKRMSNLVGKPVKEVAEELKEHIILNNDNEYELIDVYLSGNIRKKLEQAKKLVKNNPEMQRNVELLERAMPIEKTAEEISPQLGSPWIGVDYVHAFVHELGVNTSDDNFKITYEPTRGTWKVYTPKDKYGGAFKEFSTPRVSFYDMLTNALNLKTVTVYDKTQDGARVLNVKATEEARLKTKMLKDKFDDWIFAKADRRDKLVSRYNELFNSHRNMDFEKISQYLNMDDVKNISLRSHQSKAVARVLFGGDTLLAHGVGSGKTFEMIGASHELVRTGVSNKNIMVVPNHKVGDFEKDYRIMYPDAKILVSTEKDLKPANRVKFFTKVATNNWECVILPHSSFELLPISPQKQAEYIEAEIAELRNVIESMLEESGKSESTRAIKSLYNTLDNKEAELKKLLDTPKDNAVYFDDMGLGAIFVDEAHNFKNLSFYTKLQLPNIKGSASKRAQDMFIKTGVIRDSGGRIIFATATPITNTVSEMYNMTRFVRPDVLKEAGITSFDGWATTFGQVESKMEMSPDSKSFRAKERFVKYRNIQSMIGMFRQFADVVKTSDVVKTLPKANSLDILSGGNDYLSAFLDDIQSRIEGIKQRGSDNEDNMLLITSDGRAAATDLRLVAKLLDIPAEQLDLPESKINKAVENIYTEYKASNKTKGTQVVFLDFGINATGGRYDFNLYEDLIKKLVKYGIPRKEIATIHEAKTDLTKSKLFEDVNSGRVRVLIGSTAKMGEGMNVQERAIALHHLNAPYRPSDIEQRNGRVIRQGNKNKDVKLFSYIQEMSFDSYMWQTLARKGEFIAQAMSGDFVGNEMDEVDEFVLSANTAMAIATGNPLIMEKVEVDQKVKELEGFKQAYRRNTYRYDDIVLKTPEIIDGIKTKLQKLSADRELFEQKASENFSMVVGGKTVTEKEAAGEAIRKAVTKQSFNYSKIGEYNGFELGYHTTELLGIRITKLVLRGSFDHSTEISASNIGTITKIDNLLNTIENKISVTVQSLKQKAEEYEEAKRILAQPFKYESQLAENLKKQQDINAKLGVNVAEVINEDKVGDFDDVDEQITNEDHYSRGVLKGKTPESQLLGFMPSEFRPVGMDQKYTWPEEEAEKARQENRLHPTTFKAKVTERMDEFVRMSTRTFRDLPENDPLFAEAKRLTLKFKESKNYAGTMAKKYIQTFIDKDHTGLSREEFNRFSRMVLLNDLMEDMELGLALPYPYTYKNVPEFYESLKMSINQNIEAAIERRLDLVSKLANDKVKAYKKIGIDISDKYNRKNYFRHQVLEHMSMKGLSGGGSRIKGNTNRGSDKERKGTELSINEDYLQAEFEVLYGMIHDTRVAEILGDLKDNYDVTKSLKAQGKAMNQKKFDNEVAAEFAEGMSKVPAEFRADAHKLLDKHKFKALKEEYGIESPLNAAMVKAKQQIAISLDKLSYLAEIEALWDDEGRWSKAVEQLATGVKDEENNLVTKYLSVLAATDHEGNMDARSFFSGVSKKEKLIKETLGTEYMEWKQRVDDRLIPKGYATFQPVQGKHMMMINGVSEQMAEALLEAQLGEVARLQQLTGSDLKVRKMLAVAGDKLTFIMPEEVVNTITRVHHDLGASAPLPMKVVKQASNQWKQFILFTNPLRVPKYQLRNLSGDVDGMLLTAGFKAFNSNIIKIAIPDMFNAVYHGKFSKTAYEFFERGGLSDNSVVGELADINKHKIFDKFNRKSLLQKMIDLPKDYWIDPFTTAAQFRESILRYQLYMHFKEMFIKNNGKPYDNFYGASKKAMIDGLKDPRDKAYQMAMDTMIAYDQVSETTQALSKFFIPFMRFQEGNFKRYGSAVVNMVNMAKEGDPVITAAGREHAKRIGVVVGAKTAFKLGKIVVRLTAFTAMLHTWNRTMMKDYDDMLPQSVQNSPHLTLGFDPDSNSIIYFSRMGGLNDILTWFGLGSLPQDLMDLQLDRKTPKEQLIDMTYSPINKVFSAFTPFLKVPMELISGQTFFPDVRTPGKIRDRMMYITQSLGLEGLYKKFSGYPVSEQQANLVLNSFVYMANPDTIAYYKILDKKRNFEKNVLMKPSTYTVSDNPAADELYKMKLAMRFGDSKKAKEFMLNYLQIEASRGRTAGSLGNSIKNAFKSMDPLYGLNDEEAAAFLVWLTPRELKEFKTAYKFYLETLNFEQ